MWYPIFCEIQIVYTEFNRNKHSTSIPKQIPFRLPYFTRDTIDLVVYVYSISITRGVVIILKLYVEMLVNLLSVVALGVVVWQILLKRDLNLLPTLL